MSHLTIDDFKREPRISRMLERCPSINLTKRDGTLLRLGTIRNRCPNGTVRARLHPVRLKIRTRAKYAPSIRATHVGQVRRGRDKERWVSKVRKLKGVEVIYWSRVKKTGGENS